MARDHATAGPHPRNRGRRVHSLLRFLVRHMRGLPVALAAVLTAGVIAGLAAAATFFIVAWVVTRGIAQTTDERVLQWLAQHRTPALDQIMLRITALGNGTFLLVLAGIVSIVLWVMRRRWSVYLLLGGVIGGQILNRMLKLLFDRDRPSVIEWVDQVTSPSFPSGHSMGSFIAFGALAYVVTQLEPSPVLRRCTWTVAALLVAAVGFSRMYLGVHYPSDVIAGFAGGLAWLVVVGASMKAARGVAARRVSQRLAREPPPSGRPPTEPS